MTIPLQQTAELQAAPHRSGPLMETFKALCDRVLAPDAETAADRTQARWQASSLARADELSHMMTERYTLFVGLHREGLLVANFLANRYGTALAELQSYKRDLVWISGQVKDFHANKRVLVILPADAQFATPELDCLHSSLKGVNADATSVTPGAPILSVETVFALSQGPRTNAADRHDT